MANLTDALNATLIPFLERASSVAAEEIRTYIDYGERSGRFYKDKYPRRSSAKDEPPQRQFSGLYESISYTRYGPYSFAVGAVNEPPKDNRAVHLELKDPEDGGRPYIRPVMENPDTHEKMRGRP